MPLQKVTCINPWRNPSTSIVNVYLQVPASISVITKIEYMKGNYSCCETWSKSDNYRKQCHFTYCQISNVETGFWNKASWRPHHAWGRKKILAFNSLDRWKMHFPMPRKYSLTNKSKTNWTLPNFYIIYPRLSKMKNWKV